MSTRYAAKTVRVMHEGNHFKLDLKYNPATRETTRSWVYGKEKVLEIDCHLYIPKAKSSGEKVRPIICGARVRRSRLTPSSALAVPDRSACTQA